MDWGYGNASVDNLGYTLRYFGGTTMILVANIWESAPFHFVLFLHIWSNGTQNEEFLLSVFC
jgi:hypothetical protein